MKCNVNSNDRRLELGRLLTQLRGEVRPADAGIASGGRRRVPGLRRHEVAQLAGISVTWYTWLEQGRDVKLSMRALNAVASALRVDESIRHHLLLLGGMLEDLPRPRTSSPLDRGLLALLDDLLPSPAVITSPAWDFVAWNKAWALVFIDPETLAPGRRNGLWLTFMDETYRARLADWRAECRYAVARHRLIVAPYSADPRVREVHEDVMANSAEFRELWSQTLVRGFSARTQIVNHPEVGTLNFRVLQLRPVDLPDLKVVIRRPDDVASDVRLRKLLEVPT